MADTQQAELTEDKIWKTPRSRDYISIPQEIEEKLHGMNRSQIRRACGCGDKAAKALRENRPLPRLVLDEVQRNLLHAEDGSLRIRMQNSMSGPKFGAKIMIQRLKAMAQMVEAFRAKLHLTARMHEYYTFPPKSVIRQVAEALEAAYALFVRLHAECPEYDKVLFGSTPELWKQISGETKPPRKKRKSNAKVN